MPGLPPAGRGLSRQHPTGMMDDVGPSKSLHGHTLKTARYRM